MLNFMNLLRSTNQYDSVKPLWIHQNGYSENGQYQVFTRTCRNYTWHFHILMVEHKLASTKTGHMYTHRKCICMFTKRHVAESPQQHNSTKKETPQMHIKNRTYKWVGKHLYDRIQYRNENKWLYNSMHQSGESHKYNVEWRK